MTAQNLKNSILQLAVQGKLVSQKDTEEPTNYLLNRIKDEKEKLIKEGKIKKEKPLPDITEEEIPFEIPSSWAWVRLGEITSYSQTKEKISRSDITPNMWVLDLEDIEKGTGKLLKICQAFERNIAGDKVKFYSRQILYSKLRPYLKKILVAPADGICTSELVPFDLYGNIVPEFLVYVLKSPHVNYIINSVTYGVKMPRVGTETMINLLIPLPPLGEQKRIVKKIEELMPYIEEYGKAEEELSILNADFPEKLRKSILQLAVQGKLVSQSDSDEPASELLKRLQTEKELLIKESKIKKQKPSLPISEDEIPFDIPSTWRWIRLSELVSALGDGIHGTPLYDPNGAYYFINGNNLINGKITIKSDTQRVSQDEYEKYKSPLNTNTVLLSINGTIGNIAFYDNEPIILGKSACYISLLSDINKHYIRLVLQTQLFLDYAVNKATQTTIKNVSLKAMRLFPVPIPPLEEQVRIVARVEELLALCKRLEVE